MRLDVTPGYARERPIRANQQFLGICGANTVVVTPFAG